VERMRRSHRGSRHLLAELRTGSLRLKPKDIGKLELKLTLSIPLRSMEP
jgi:hypothetical protein